MKKTEKVESNLGYIPEVINTDDKNYYGTWSSSQYLTEQINLPPCTLAEHTLRQVIRTSIAGDAIRVKFSNLCGESDIVIGEAHIAISTGYASMDISTDTVILFNGKRGITIPKGQEVYSDTFKFDLPAITNIAISIYFNDMPKQLTGHPGSRTTSYISKGNTTGKEQVPGAPTDHWYVLAGIDICSSQKHNGIVCLGDSITDGRGSTTNAQNRWTDILATRLQQNEGTKNIAVLNQGIGGTIFKGSGESRFDHDVLGQSGANYIILLYGVNDIIYAKFDMKAITETYKNLINKAHLAGKKIYGGTILPFGKCGEYKENLETVRQEVNTWIRNTSTADGGFDGCIDFDSVMRDPNDKKSTLVEFNCGDGLHPSPEGYVQMAKEVDISLFK